MFMSLQGKKILILGGAFQHCKAVETAKELGVRTYVTDFLQPEDAPGKQIADHWYMYNITDYDDILALCKKEEIDGVMMLCLDATQKPYQQICEMGGYPCFGNREQYHILTDKKAFKEFCRQCGVDTIPEYAIECFEDRARCEKEVCFPVYVKPSNNRGSRGQYVCENYEQTVEAIRLAQKESSTGEVIIERYMREHDDFSMSYLMIDGEAFLIRTCDCFPGEKTEKLDKIHIASLAPSKYTDMYMEKVHDRVVEMIRKLGIQNGPVFMQGFVDGDTVRFYDPGLRLPGTEYERVFHKVYGINPVGALVEFALTGEISEEYKAMPRCATLNGNVSFSLYITIKPGTIGRIYGEEEIKAHPAVVSMFRKYSEGETIGELYNVNQRFCEIEILCSTMDELLDVADWVYRTLRVEDVNGQDMLNGKLDLSQFE